MLQIKWKTRQVFWHKMKTLPQSEKISALNAITLFDQQRVRSLHFENCTETKHGLEASMMLVEVLEQVNAYNRAVKFLTREIILPE